MNTQIAILEQVLRDLYVTFEADPDVEWCITFEVPGSEVWLQLMGNTLNLHWPFDKRRAFELSQKALQALPHCALVEVEPWKFATYAIERPPVAQMAALLDRLFREVYHLDDDYRFTFDIQQL